MMTITLSWPSADLSPNARVHWSARNRASKAAKNEAWGLTKALMHPLGIKMGHTQGPVRITYTFHPKITRGRDDDNFAARMKPARDGIAMALGLDDVTFIMQPVQWGGRKDMTVDVELVQG